MYIREAHPSDGWRPAKHIDIEDPKTLGERDRVAGGCAEALKLKMPCVVDDMQDTFAKAYNAKPDRLFILGADAKIAYRGERGPRGFDVDGMEAALKKILASVKPGRSESSAEGAKK